MSTDIEITGLDALQRKLGNLVADATINRAIKASAVHLKGKVSKYPANQPPANPRIWYVRGFGSKWRRKDGSIGQRQSSETLGKRWTIRTGNRWAVVGNNASYGPYVQDPQRQTKVMARRNWKTTAQVSAEERDKIMSFFVAEIRKAWNK